MTGKVLNVVSGEFCGVAVRWMAAVSIGETESVAVFAVRVEVMGFMVGDPFPAVPQPTSSNAVSANKLRIFI
jgi:hypothetical protein